jgi:4-amino-4-deoxy-L-arabinose transferase-like glycosyltransferase
VASALLSFGPPPWIADRINRWFDAAPGGQAVWILLALFVAIWAGFQVISYASIDLHPDLLEVFAWSQNLAPGFKHPPLAGLIAAAWFAVFPIADWSFHVLAMVNAALALFAVDLIARRYLDGDKRLLVLLLLMLTPLYQFHGQRFSTNQVLLSVWPIATYCFLRSFEQRSLLWSVAAGAAAALAMLGKYYSIVLVAAFVVAALAHPRRVDYLRSPAPWISVLAGVVVLAPHLHWLLTTGGSSVSYVQQVHGGGSTVALLRHAIVSLMSAIGYVLIPLAAYGLLVRPDRRTLAATVWPSDPDRRMLVVLFAMPFLLSIALLPIIGVRFSGLWTMPAWFLLPIILLAPSQVVVKRFDAVRLAYVILCLSVAALAASPAVAWARFAQEAGRPGRAHFAAVSQEVTRAWRRAVERPLPIVASGADFEQAATFYSSDRPQSWNFFDPLLTPWISEDRRQREGWAAVCPAAWKDCIAAAERAAGSSPGAVRLEFEHAATFLGRHGPPLRFVFVLVPPSR